MPRGVSVVHEVEVIRQSLSSVTDALQRLAAVLESKTDAPAASRRPRRRMPMSPARREALRLQGRYMTYVRTLGSAHATRVKAVRAAKGMRAALALAKRLAG